MAIMLLASLNEVVGRRDAAAIRFAGHALQGSSQTQGFEVLGKPADRLEKQREAASDAALSACLHNTERAFVAACEHLQRSIGGGRA